ncbi:DNA repair protein RecN [Leucobacter luti]|uniref:DNA repair protein RecN n=1 Tax=Leucobacter luti TaxID=340320 RepID=A0A4Q7U6L3_9MICO|nr:DNA repair protein RecN [Leucobacter luti]MBL3700873.1 DNA repair protein RecN [Leucobacter luti]RZT68288.1 DNA replication and repair protein RecN [Leucobacter luti]
MIDELRIRDLGVIADATLPLGPGFTAITGETGAGKTMVVSALGLLMGERSDAGAVRAGAAQARVNGLIHTADPAVAELVDELGGDVEDGELVLSRTVSAEGRSRASVGGASTPVGSLAKLAERLFAVHGQSEQLRLRSAAAQRDTLDRFGGAELGGVLAEYRAAHRARRELAERVAELTAARDERAAEAARLKAELDEIAAVDPQPGEDAELTARIDLLSNVEALRSATAEAHEALATESDDPMSRDAGSLIDAAVRELERVAAHDERLGTVLEALRSVSFQVADAARELAAYVDDLDVEGPGELARANQRLAALNGLFRLYGVDAAAVIEYSAHGAVRLTELEGDDELIGELARQLDDVTAQERSLANRLTELRTAAAARLSELVTVELRQLALPDAAFTVLVTPLDALGGAGADEVQLLLSPHPGATPRPIAKSASGGELSRVMLALEVVVAGVDPVPTFVFDEVDAGVGGAAAIEIGRRLARLARSSQVIVVTHLAQVAAFAGNHLQVVKDSAGGFTESSCRRLDGDERLAEMARLLSGLSDSESALEHAAELLALREE